MVLFWLISLPSGKASSASALVPQAIQAGNFNAKQKIFYGLRSQLSSTTSGSSSSDVVGTSTSSGHADFHAHVSHFPVPDLKMGTLDELVTLGDDLVKIDQYVEGVLKKMVDTTKMVLRDRVDLIQASLVVKQKPVESYLRSFMWNTTKYRTDKSLREVVDAIRAEVGGMETVLKSKLSAYNATRSNLSGLERKRTGNLSVRSLNDIIKKEHFVLGSEYLMTLLVAVPVPLVETWYQIYEKLTPMVVPRSTTRITEDDEYVLFNVTVFRRVADEFRGKAREHRLVVRDVGYDENEMKATREKLQSATSDEKEQWAALSRLLKTNFGEVFSCWMHVKAVRIFVESVLRYGLPADFLTCLVQPRPRHEKKAREVLQCFSDHLRPDSAATSTLRSSSSAGSGKKHSQHEDEADVARLLVGHEKEYFEYASFTFQWEVDGA